MKGKVEGKIAIVTGGAMGMGYGVVTKLLQYGAKVTIIDYSNELDGVVKKLQGEGAEVQGFHADVRDKAALVKIYDGVAAKYGRIDILVNVAGISKSMPYLTDEGADAELELCMGVNFRGVWNSCQAAVPHMIKQKYGKIVNFSSVTGPVVVDPGMTAYASSKGAVSAFTRALASETAAAGITVNAILPGAVDTPLLRKSASIGCPENPQSILDAMAAAVPMKRLGRPEEAGEVAAFLASDESSYLTGIGIVFDGGNTLPETRDTGWTPEEVQ